MREPEKIIIVYLEIAPNQFIELFSRSANQKEHIRFNESLGYSCFALTVDGIHQAREELVHKGVKILTEPKIGNSHTWQMWIADPDNNRIEIMQFTDESYQLTGHIG